MGMKRVDISLSVPDLSGDDNRTISICPFIPFSKNHEYNILNSECKIKISQNIHTCASVRTHKHMLIFQSSFKNRSIPI